MAARGPHEPSKEPAGQDKIHLLMEETGCDQGQAELALTSAGYDLERAIRTIATLLRDIVVARAKFLLPEKNIYGLLNLIADTRRRRFHRLRAVVSYNPALYETSLNLDWYEFEKCLYAFRLWEGTLQQITQELEQSLLPRLEREEGVYDALREDRDGRFRERVAEMLAGFFAGAGVDLVMEREALSLDQYKRLRARDDVSTLSGAAAPVPVGQGGNLLLDAGLEQDPDGIPAREVKPGDAVRVLLTDERDIAQYLSKLLGGRQGEDLRALTATVEETRREGEAVHFQIRLSAGIMGLAQAHAASLIHVQRARAVGWWRRWVPGL